jgi:N-acetylneuraminic acid mutarotase
MLLHFLSGLLLVSCYNLFLSKLDNPVDPNAPSYQGYPTVDSTDKISLVGPTVGSVVVPGSPVSFLVSEVKNAQNYEMQISLSETAFESEIIHKQEIQSNILQFPAYTGSGGRFYWRCRAKDASGVWGAWSPVTSYVVSHCDGTIGSWNRATSLPSSRALHTSVVYNGYLYVIGGYTSSTTYSTEVYYAPLNPNGTLGSWSSTTSLPSGRYSHTSVVYNGYLYVIGGRTSSTYYSTEVYYAPLNPNGTLGSWSSTTSLPSGRYSHTSVVYNGYLYVIGGRTSSTTYSTEVYYAPLNPNGTLGSWSSTTSLPSGRYSHTSVVYNGYLYVIGGDTSSTTVPKSTTLPSIPTAPWAPGPPPPPSPPVEFPILAWRTTATCM